MGQLTADIISNLKQYDPDRYAASFFAPADKRDGLLLLYAFNMELDRIPYTVSEPTLGEIKLQWWRDTIERSKEGQRSGNPLADGICDLISYHNLPMVRVMEMIDARSFELSDEPFQDFIDLKIYLKKTSISLLKLALRVLSEDVDQGTDKAAEEAAMSYGLARILNHLPENLSKGKLYIPLSVLKDHNVSEETLRQGKNSVEFKNAVKKLSDISLQHLLDFKELEKNTSSKFGPAFLPVTLVGAYTDIVNSGRHDLLRELVTVNPLFRLWKYWRASAFGVY